MLCVCVCVRARAMALSLLLEEHAEFDTVARKGNPALLQALAARICGCLSVCVCVCVYVRAGSGHSLHA